MLQCNTAIPVSLITKCTHNEASQGQTRDVPFPLRLAQPTFIKRTLSLLLVPRVGKVDSVNWPAQAVKAITTAWWVIVVAIVTFLHNLEYIWEGRVDGFGGSIYCFCQRESFENW